MSGYPRVRENYFFISGKVFTARGVSVTLRLKRGPREPDIAGSISALGTFFHLWFSEYP